MNKIEKARKTLEDAGYIVILWSDEDVIELAKNKEVELSEDQVKEVMKNIDHYHDANEGINWDVISCHIDMVINK